MSGLDTHSAATFTVCVCCSSLLKHDTCSSDRLLAMFMGTAAGTTALDQNQSCGLSLQPSTQLTTQGAVHHGLLLCFLFYMMSWCHAGQGLCWGCRWGATPLQDAYLSGDKVMCALLERAGGKTSDDPAIKGKLPAQMV